MKELGKILRDNGISPAKKEPHLEDIILDSGKIMEDLFETFGKIFGPQYRIDLKKNIEIAKKKPKN